MSNHSLYKETLLKHYKHPCNRSNDALQDADIVRRGSNPRCGDEIEIGLYLDNDHIEQVKFRGRGCSVCIASTSMMTVAISGKSKASADEMYQHMVQWFQDGEGNEMADPPDDLQALSAVRAYPARRKCVFLSWEALASALKDI